MVYDAPRRCVLTHPEGHALPTDVPRELGGDASAFSPTEMLAGALGACVLTTLGLFAERRGLDLAGMRAVVVKEMAPNGRRIARLAVRVTLPPHVPAEMRPVLEKIAHSCPIHASLHPDIDAPIAFDDA